MSRAGRIGIIGRPEGERPWPVHQGARCSRTHSWKGHARRAPSCTQTLSALAVTTSLWFGNARMPSAVKKLAGLVLKGIAGAQLCFSCAGLRRQKGWSAGRSGSAGWHPCDGAKTAVRREDSSETKISRIGSLDGLASQPGCYRKQRAGVCDPVVKGAVLVRFGQCNRRSRSLALPSGRGSDPKRRRAPASARSEDREDCGSVQ